MNVENLKKDTEHWIKNYFKNKGSYNKAIYDSMYYSISVGGKRIRPILMLLTYSMYKEDYKDILPVACAVEMIHTYSLIHDDLPCMDNDDLRRGKPTNHKVYGEAMATLSGDGLLNEAMSIMFKYVIENKRGLEACYSISVASGVEGMIAGQVVDILGEGKKLSKEELNYMHKKKTGELIKAPIVAGALLGAAPKEDVEKLSLFGEKLGLAFQIKDDILDVIGDVNSLGKNTKSDAEKNKATFVSQCGLQESIDFSKKVTSECIEILHKINGNTQDLESLTLFLLNRNN
ncbi:polyprenyl synthetase family protein [Haloimpatiens sp. FM7315]|uniref:polyprenyl synthetase family protein n=1 Tax=Haloimpatiens sp. FM7315 TaxID=3298609 RepID=UPI0035A2EE53